MANTYKRLNYDPIGGASTAAGVSYDNADSGLTATNVQDAIDEVQGNVESEAIDRAAADSAEATARQNADDTLQDNIDAEEAARIAADALLIPLAQKGQPNGVATLDGSGLVPSSQLPSYVDDVLEFPNLAAFPVTGETGKIYIAQDTNFQYRWSGSAYFQLSVSPVSSVFGRTGAVVAVSGDYTASQVTNVPAGTISGVTVQAAVNELDSDIQAEITRAQLAESDLQDDIDLVQQNLTDHITDTVGAHAASAISNTPAGTISATTVQAAINELDSDVQLVQSNLDTHISSTTAHAAEDLTYDNSVVSELTATDIQGAIDELATRPSGADGDIVLTTFTLAANQTDSPITGLSFISAIKGFDILATVTTDTLAETFQIVGTKRASDYTVSLETDGDDTGVTFDCTSGQVTYSSGAFTTGSISFRAIITR
jgi:hypothetical protein